MLLKNSLSLVLLFVVLNLSAQNNFHYQPEKPKPGDIITITYQPAGAIAATAQPAEAIYYTVGGQNTNADDMLLTRKGNVYTGTIKTDTANNFIYLGFSSDNKFDNNFNEGYYILLNDGNGVKKGAYNNLAIFYQFLGQQVGVDRNNDKALESIEKELELHPADRNTYLPTYLQLVSAVKKTEAPAIIQKEIEGLLKKGLKAEDDYALLERIYGAARLPEQAKLIADIRKEKYPQGKWQVAEKMQQFFMEQDPEQAAKQYAGIAEKVQTDSNWKYLQPNIENYQLQVPYLYARKKDWTGLQSYLTAHPLKDAVDLSAIYNNIAWEMQGKNEDLSRAEELSRFATEYAKKEMTQPTAKKPAYLTPKQWEKSRKGVYAMYADTYAMVLYRLGNYKKGFPYAQEAALTIGEGKNATTNNTYALLAEKVLPAKQYQKQIETFLKNGKATGEMKDILKRAYTKQKGSDTGFDEYITSLEKESYLKTIAELRKSMLNETAPSFALLDLDSNNVALAGLKGKTVVVDFWATWCGPCKASFPSMQKMVTKYKDDPNVKFVFVDTWERVDNKKQNAADFISSNKYSFQVLMDNDNKVVEQFNVEGIPTKFVIDKNGRIRFKSVGFDGNDKLTDELTAMIELASSEDKKAF